MSTAEGIEKFNEEWVDRNAIVMLWWFKGA
jgi:hypothetical protein